VSASWRLRCRECGEAVAPGRAWCSRHLRAVRAGIPTDLDSIPRYEEAKAVETGAADRPFPFWPTAPRRP
jgi:hypothetical protein